MSQSEPVKNAGSTSDAFIGSEAGGCFEASPISGIGVIRMAWTAAPELLTSIVATPGITVGGRIVT